MQLVYRHKPTTAWGRVRTWQGCHGQRDARAGRARISSASGSTRGWAPSRSCSTYAGSECRSGLVSTVAPGLRLSTQTSGGCRLSRPSGPTWDHPASTAGHVITTRRPCLPSSLFEDVLPVVVLDGPNGPGADTVITMRQRGIPGNGGAPQPGGSAPRSNRPSWPWRPDRLPRALP